MSARTADDGPPTESASVITVRGPVAPAALGMVLPHEHLLGRFVPPPGSALMDAVSDLAFYTAPLRMGMLGRIALGDPNADNWVLDDEALAVAELAPQGGPVPGTATPSIVDLGSAGLGRDPRALARIAAATGRHIVMGAGWYHPAWAAAAGNDIAASSAASLTVQLVTELTEGIDGIPAGVIGAVAALDPNVPAEGALLAAVARASAATGAPIAIDCGPTVAATQRMLDALLAEGAAPSRIALTGCDRLSPEPSKLDGLVLQGVSVMFDSVGRLPTVYNSYADADVAAAILHLAGRGFSERVMLSQGVASKAQLLAYGGGGYSFLTEQFLPYLGFMFGADEALLQAITVTNPQRWLARPATADGGSTQARAIEGSDT